MPAINRIDTATRAAPEAATARDAKALVRRALVREPKLRAKMVRLAKTDYVRGRDFQRVYLRSFPAKVAAVVAAGKKLGMDLTDAQVIALAKGIDPFKGTGEAVRTYPKPKAGGYRPITTFGAANKALQILVKQAAEPFIKIHPHQFDARGHGGPPAACRRILELIGEGYVHVVVADVEANFNALRAEGIKETIPLPPAVTEAVVLARGLNINPHERRYHDAETAEGQKRGAAAPTPKAPRARKVSVPNDAIPRRAVIVRRARSGLKHPSRLRETMRKGRRGISQGSMGSPLYSAAIHALMVGNISRLAPVVHYTDNFYVFAKTGKGALRAAKALKAEFQRSPAGPLLFSSCAIKDAREGFAALGYIFKVRNGRAKIQVPGHKLERQLNKFMETENDVYMGLRTPEDAVESVDRWCAAHRLWPFWRLWRSRVLRRLARDFPEINRMI